MNVATEKNLLVLDFCMMEVKEIESYKTKDCLNCFCRYDIFSLRGTINERIILKNNFAFLLQRREM